MPTLTLLSPVLVDFHCIPGAALAAPDAYSDFWQAADAVSQTVLIEDHPTLAPAALVCQEPRRHTGLNLYRGL